MQKGIIFDIKRFAVHDGPGIRTTVFFKGCPFNCRWCHNPESINPNPQKMNKQVALDGKIYEKTEIIGREMSVTELLKEILKDKIFYRESGGGVTFSGGEPLLQIDFLKELLIECKKERLHVTLDTCGFASSEYLEEIMDQVDLLLFDLKIIDNQLHRKFIGNSNEVVLKNLKLIAEFNKECIIRIPIVPKVTDTKINQEQILDFLLKLPRIKEINLLPYHRIASEKYKRLNMTYYDFPEPDQEKLDTIKHFWKEAGYEVKIGG